MNYELAPPPPPLPVTLKHRDLNIFHWDIKTEKIPNVTSKFLSYVKMRLLNMTWSNLRLNV